MASLDERVGSLEGWRNDLARELREWEDWVGEMRPFLEQLEQDLLYRQRRRAERGQNYSTTAKVIAAAGGILIALATVGGFVLELIILSHGHGG